MAKRDIKPQDRVPFHQQLIYGSGAFVNNLLADSIGRLVIVLNLGLGMNPAVAGLVAALPRFYDALSDPLIGHLSDHTKTKWGRRRPYIFSGAILVAIVFALIWQVPQGQTEGFYFWWFLGGLLIFYTAYTVFATPWVALGYEMTPDYDERTRLMGTQNFIGQSAYMFTPWLIAIIQLEMFAGSAADDPVQDGLNVAMVEGVANFAIFIAVFVAAVGILPAIFLRERYKEIADKENAADSQKRGFFAGTVHNVTGFFQNFASTLSFIPFLKLCIATFLIFNGFILIAAFQSYVIIYYVAAGDAELGAFWVGWAGTVTAMSAFAAVFIVTVLGNFFGKKAAFTISISISVIGYIGKWFSYNPDMPWLVVLPMPLVAFGLGGLFTLMPAMMADVVDLDELRNHKRREGLFGSIYWWVVKLGQSVAIAGGGYLLLFTGFEVTQGGDQSENTLFLLRVFDVAVPVVGSIIAIWVVSTLQVSKKAALEVRRQLEERRGAAEIAPAPAE
jgi:GPH family glycoside/pentoside/hexuronide:cation symporter